MYPQHIQEAAAAIGRTLTESATPLYGSGLRLPDRRAVIELVKEVRRLLFPAYFGDPALMSLAPENYAALLLERIREKLTEQLKLALPEDQVDRAEEITREFARRLPQVQKLLLEDLDATFESDPAAASREEIIFAYPGLFAIFVYRIAHLLYCQRVPMIPRIMSEYAHSRTGIDIHPGASIGPHFFIDHGTGIVVGETTVIGRNVKLYQGVTLGAMSPRAGPRVSARQAPSHRGGRRDHLFRRVHPGGRHGHRRRLRGGGQRVFDPVRPQRHPGGRRHPGPGAEKPRGPVCVYDIRKGAGRFVRPCGNRNPSGLGRRGSSACQKASQSLPPAGGG